MSDLHSHDNERKRERGARNRERWIEVSRLSCRRKNSKEAGEESGKWTKKRVLDDTCGKMAELGGFFPWSVAFLGTFDSLQLQLFQSLASGHKIRPYWFQESESTDLKFGTTSRGLLSLGQWHFPPLLLLSSPPCLARPLKIERGWIHKSRTN